MSTEIVKQDPRIGESSWTARKGKALIAQVAPKHLTADAWCAWRYVCGQKQPASQESAQMSILKNA